MIQQQGLQQVIKRLFLHHLVQIWQKDRDIISQELQFELWAVVNTWISLCYPVLSCRTRPVWRCRHPASRLSWWRWPWRSGWPPTGLRRRRGGVSTSWGSATVWSSSVETSPWFSTRSVQSLHSKLPQVNDLDVSPLVSISCPEVADFFYCCVLNTYSIVSTAVLGLRKSYSVIY